MLDGGGTLLLGTENNKIGPGAAKIVRSGNLVCFGFGENYIIYNNTFLLNNLINFNDF
jgi:hypothetical protein